MRLVWVCVPFVFVCSHERALLDTLVCGAAPPPPTAVSRGLDRAFWRAQIARYEAFLAEQAARSAAAAPPLVPARCVYHLWLVHMLQPSAYRLDCEATRFGAVVPHEYPVAPPPLDGCVAFQAWEAARATTPPRNPSGNLL